MGYNLGMNTVKLKRRNYSLAPARANDLAENCLNLSRDLDGATVNRQDVLDTLVGLMSADKTVYNKVFRILKRQK